MSKIVNLRAARKSKARAESRRAADANAVRHGLTKAEKKLAAARNAQARARIDAHRRDKE